ncbi:hypothetical protein [Streptomyces sp. NA03103]|uniref:hypothetical protein n=1 Tax=Streptomyces sp. NA03103 TaxID=2742134 RepID=UPI0015910CC0|nr:hypothetical protein [Streptomyces sp. NA03103]
MGYSEWLDFASLAIVTNMLSWLTLRRLGLSIASHVRKESWRKADESKIASFCRKRRRVIEGKVRVALAVSRYCGSAVEVEASVIRRKVELAVWTGRWIDRAYMWVAVVTPFSILGVAALFAAFGASGPSSWTLDEENLKNALAGQLAVMNFILFSRASVRLHSKYNGAAADLGALLQCVDVLDKSKRVIRGDGGILDLEVSVNHLVSNLEKYSQQGVRISKGSSGGLVRAHVSLVRERLAEGMADVLREGPVKAPELVRLIATILSRIVEERWLCLLDEAQPGGPEAPDPVVDDIAKRRRDTGIIVAGSIGAAAAMGLATAAGIPLAVSFPVAMVLLMGPAAIWGSRKLGASPGGLLDSVRGTVGEPPQPGVAGQQQLGGPNLVPPGGPR